MLNFNFWKRKKVYRTEDVECLMIQAAHVSRMLRQAIADGYKPKGLHGTNMAYPQSHVARLRVLLQTMAPELHDLYDNFFEPVTPSGGGKARNKKAA